MDAIGNCLFVSLCCHLPHTDVSPNVLFSKSMNAPPIVKKKLQTVVSSAWIFSSLQESIRTDMGDIRLPKKSMTSVPSPFQPHLSKKSI